MRPLGLPDESDWILYYPHPSYDQTMLYNTFIWELAGQTGRYGTGFRFVDVFVNEDGGDLTMADRRGVYALAEKVERGAGRIDFDELSDDGATGGWLLGINRMDAIPPGGFPAENGATSPQFFHTAGPNRIQQTPPNSPGQGDDIPRQYNAYINFEDPNGYRINPAQRAAIEAWFREFEDVFYDDARWRDPEEGYRKYLNTRDFIDYFHLLNLAKQGDGLLISIFPWVSSGERKLHMVRCGISTTGPMVATPIRRSTSARIASGTPACSKTQTTNGNTSTAGTSCAAARSQTTTWKQSSIASRHRSPKGSPPPKAQADGTPASAR